MKTALVLAVLTSSALAQIPIPPHATVYNGFSRGMNFTANTNFLMTQLDLPLDAQQAGDTAGYGVRVNGTVVYQSGGNAGSVAVSIPIFSGDVVDVVGNWSPAAPAQFTAHNSYGGPAPFASTIEGVAHTLNRTGVQWDISDPVGSATAAWLAPGTGNIGRVFMFTAPLSGTVATNDNVGGACQYGSDSFYELFADAALAAPALTDGVLFLTPTADGYQGAWAPATASALYVAPTAAALPVATGDDGQVTFTPSVPMPSPYGPQTDIQIHGNAMIGFGASPIDYPNTNAYTPTAEGFLNSGSGGIYAWHDYNQNEGGQIVTEEVGGVLYVSYVDIESYSTPVVLNPSTLQFQIDLNTGEVRIVFLSIDGDASSTFGSGHLVGVTAPGASTDDGGIMLATATAADLLTGTQTGPISLAATSRPIAPGSWDLTVSDMPASAVFGVNWYGLSDPMISDLAIIGLPGCELHANLDVLEGPWIPAGGSYSYSLPLGPWSGSANELFAQAAAFSPNFLAPPTVTSNAVKGTTGDV